MAYINKNNILTAYKKLSEMYPEHKQGATQKVSAIRYFLALDAYYKKYNTNCNTREPVPKKEFADLVGIVCSVCLDLYTPDFYYPLKNGNGDFCVGSNFYSAGQVSDSLINPQQTFDYPKRGGKPLFRIQNGVLTRDITLYSNLYSYLVTTEYRVALVVWLIRKSNVNINNDKTSYDNIHDTLDALFTPDLVKTLIGNKDEFSSILDTYALSFNENFYSIKEDDIKNMFNIKSPHDTNPKDSMEDNNKYTHYLAAIRTKPFVLLAGISGTGKSRIVRKLAQATDDIDKFENEEARWNCHKPANFALIQVKPNWHNSMDVVGYKSNIGTPHYEFTPFVEFVAKAWRNIKTPFFLCLDEMNLAPVEEYCLVLKKLD